jgi:hypothetical protein
VASAWSELIRLCFGAATDENIMNTRRIPVVVAAVLQFGSAPSQTITVIDPTSGFDRLFGLGGHACKQYDDTGRLFIYGEGVPSLGVTSWLQRSNGGTRADTPMPTELVVALPRIPGCLPGKHHAAAPSR